MRQIPIDNSIPRAAKRAPRCRDAEMGGISRDSKIRPSVQAYFSGPGTR